MELTMTNSFGFCELNENELMMIDGGGMLSSILIGAGICAVGTVILAASCGPLAPVVILGHSVSAKVVAGVAGAVVGGIGGAIRGALN